jgi:hypothetical protein
MRKAHHTLEITMGDYENPVVLNNGEEVKEYVMSLLNKGTYKFKWRGRGKRKQHAIANGLRARGFDQDLPLEFAERQVLYLDVRPPTKKQKEAIRLREADNEIRRYRNTVEWHLTNNDKTEEALERGEAELDLARDQLKEAIRHRSKITDTVKEV